MSPLEMPCVAINVASSIACSSCKKCARGLAKETPENKAKKLFVIALSADAKLEPKLFVVSVI